MTPLPRENYKPNMILATTARCNYRCRMCFWSNTDTARNLIKSDPTMDMETFSKTLSEAASFCNSVSLTASGEFLEDPHKDERLAVLGNWLRENPHVRYTQISNGSMLTSDNIAFLANTKEVTFHISLDSTNPLEYSWIRRPGTLGPLLENIRNLRPNLHRIGVQRVNIRLGVVLMKCNIFSLPDIIRLADEIGATLTYDHVQNFNSTGIQEESLFSHPAFSNRYLATCHDLARKLHVRIDRPPSFALTEPPPEKQEMLNHCYQLETAGPLQIQPDGTVFACCKGIPIGNIRKAPINKIVFGEKMEALRSAIAAGKPLPPCNTCRFLRRKGPVLFNSADYGWNIPPETRNNDENPDFEAGGFTHWLDGIPKNRLHKDMKLQQLQRVQTSLADISSITNSTALKRIKAANSIIFKAITENRKIIVHGTGADTTWLMENTLLPHAKIIAFSSFSTLESKKEINGIPVIDTNTMQSFNPDLVLIAEELFVEKIRRQLIKINKPDQEIIPLFYDPTINPNQKQAT